MVLKHAFKNASESSSIFCNPTANYRALLIKHIEKRKREHFHLKFFHITL